MRKIVDEKSATGIRIKEFGKNLKTSPPVLSRSKQLIFLCGANKSPGEVSVRRSSVKKFIDSLSSSYTAIYAEGIFNELKKFEQQKNSLDLEYWISEVADKVVIILESESTFCELGAFSHKDLRHKLIVINNEAFRTSESFINTGPIAALTEIKSPVMWYPMSREGITTLDGIGAIFSELKLAISSNLPEKKALDFDKLSQLPPNKNSLYFLHDLILLLSPITHEEVILVLGVIFGHKNLDIVKNLLGVLREAKLVKTKKINSKWLYEPTSTDFFLNYTFNLNALMSACRCHHMRFNSERFSNA